MKNATHAKCQFCGRYRCRPGDDYPDTWAGKLLLILKDCPHIKLPLTLAAQLWVYDVRRSEGGVTLDTLKEYAHDDKGQCPFDDTGAGSPHVEYDMTYKVAALLWEWILEDCTDSEYAPDDAHTPQEIEDAIDQAAEKPTPDPESVMYLILEDLEFVLTEES